MEPDAIEPEKYHRREEFGGNYWGQPDGKGFSQVTPGTRGICDQHAVLATGNVDRLPLK